MAKKANPPDFPGDWFIKNLLFLFFMKVLEDCQGTSSKKFLDRVNFPPQAEKRAEPSPLFCGRAAEERD